jgi:hypothetical protein
MAFICGELADTKDIAQMLLADGRPDLSGRRSDDRRRLAGDGFLPDGLGQSIAFFKVPRIERLCSGVGRATNAASLDGRRLFGSYVDLALFPTFASSAKREAPRVHPSNSPSMRQETLQMAFDVIVLPRAEFETCFSSMTQPVRERPRTCCGSAASCSSARAAVVSQRRSQYAKQCRVRSQHGIRSGGRFAP